MAHTIEGAALFGVEEKKLAAVWEYQSNSLFSEAERVALDFAVAASVVPNAVTDRSFEDLRKHWSEEQIVEIVATIAMFGFLNRWNDTMGTPLEEEALAAGDKYLARGGWAPGRQRRQDLTRRRRKDLQAEIEGCRSGRRGCLPPTDAGNGPELGPSASA